MIKENTTNNITVPNRDLEVLKIHFSHCFDKNSNFNFEKFKQELSENEINFSKESYGMDWLGKSYARLLASDEATTLLQENEEWNEKQENKNSGNLLIKGDNLEVLKHLSNAYYEKVKMIYIDPPYNTGSDGFVYADDRKFTVQELSELAGVEEDKAKRILDFTQSKSNSHSAWLTFMYPRLYIAKQLLKDDGVIFVSIDGNEVAQLRFLMDEIFGEENFVGEITRKQSSGSKNDTGNNKIITNIDKLIVYSKGDFEFLPIIQKNTKKYSLKDDWGKYSLRALEMQGGDDTLNLRPKMGYSIYFNPKNEDLRIKFDYSLEKKEVYGILDKELIKKNYRCYRPKKRGIKFGRWRWGNEKFKDEFSKGNIEFKNGRVFQKERSKDNLEKFPDSLCLDFINTQGTLELKQLFSEKVFDFPKPIGFIKKYISHACFKEDIILDFFAGSGTIGDAVMQLNAEDNGNRKYILVQLPEKIDQKKNKTAYDFVKDELKQENPTIFNITKERLIRAGKKIQEDNKNKDLSKQDFGFKIFETTPIWEDYDFEAESFDPQTKLFDESKLSEEDIQTLLTTWKTYDGIILTQNLNKINLDGYTGYYFDNKLYLMDKKFKTKNLKKLLEEIDENKDFNPATVIVFGYNFGSKNLREIAENIKNYANKKQIDIDFITRY